MSNSMQVNNSNLVMSVMVHLNKKLGVLMHRGTAKLVCGHKATVPSERPDDNFLAYDCHFFAGWACPGIT